MNAAMFGPVAAFALLAALACPNPASAQTSDEELFGEGSSMLSTPADSSKDIAGASLETTKALVFGGDITLVQSLDPWSGTLRQSRGSLQQNLGLNFDARPTDTFRVHGRSRYTIADSVMDGTFSLQELFVDLSWNRSVLVRAGKQAANWGLGRWWSPADILSLEPIDQSDPSALRSGPVAIKASVPLGLGQASAYATTQGAANAGQVGLAGRCEFVLGDSEFGLGGYWRGDGAVKPRLVGTASLRFLGIDWYGEAVGSLGSETQVVGSNSGIPVISQAEGPLFQGAAGFSWRYSDSEGRGDLAANGEYYYNGHGAADPSAYAALSSQFPTLVKSGALYPGALMGYGRQYAGLALSAEDLWASKLGLDADWRSNLSEASGYARAAAVYEPVSDLRLEAGGEAWYGGAGSEYPAMDSGASALYAVASIRLWTNTTLEGAYPLFGDKARPRLSLLVFGQF